MADDADFLAQLAGLDERAKLAMAEAAEKAAAKWAAEQGFLVDPEAIAAAAKAELEEELEAASDADDLDAGSDVDAPPPAPEMLRRFVARGGGD